MCSSDLDNFRSGLTFSGSINNAIYIGNPGAPFGSTLDGRIIYHQPFSGDFGFSSQLRYRQWRRWSEDTKSSERFSHDSAGDMLRGIRNNELEASDMLSLSMDLSARVLRFWPSEWFDSPRLSFFNMEFHLTPFLDLSLARGSLYQEGITFSLNDLITSAGMELIIFSGYFRSLSLRAMLGLDLNKLGSRGFREVFSNNWFDFYIGMERAY